MRFYPMHLDGELYGIFRTPGAAKRHCQKTALPDESAVVIRGVVMSSNRLLGTISGQIHAEDKPGKGEPLNRIFWKVRNAR